jgi:hypothetical protein
MQAGSYTRSVRSSFCGYRFVISPCQSGLHDRASPESRFSFTPLDPLLGKAFGCEKRIWSMKNDDLAVKSERLGVKSDGAGFRFSRR